MRDSASNLSLTLPARSPLARRYSAALQSGDQPNLREWLAREQGLSVDSAVEVMQLDLVHGWRRHQGRLVEYYLHECPDLALSDDQIVSLIVEEFAVRTQVSGNVGIGEYARRFPQLASRLTGELQRAVRADLQLPLPSFSIDTALGLGSTCASSRPLDTAVNDVAQRLPQIPGYDILGHLASGGMGAVFRARDATLQREVAIKFPHAGFFSSDAVKERFLREARASAKLTHANICPVYEVREVQGRPYICMALIHGVTLRAWATKSQPGPRRIAEMVSAIARAVQYAHEQGVVHRDLKPSNVIVQARGEEPVLMDFGLAKDLSQEDGLTISGEVLGTPAYMAPEQASGKIHEQGPLVDVYALGAILYELLGGQPPFQGTIAEVLQKVLSSEPAALRSLNRTVHIDLDTICQKAMAKRPADRYATAGELAADLARFAAGEPIQARRPSIARRAARWLGKRRVAISVSALVLLACGLLAAAIPMLTHSTRLSQLSHSLQADLAAPDWTIEGLPQADQALEEIAAIAPYQRDSVARQISARIVRYATDQLEQGRLSDEDWQRIDAALLVLTQRDPDSAAELQLEADRRRGLWQRVYSLHAPFPSPVAEFSRLQVDASATRLRLEGHERAQPGEVATLLSSQSSPSRTQLEADFYLPANGRCGLLLNVRESHVGGVTATAVSADGKQIASATWAGDFIMLWNAETGDRIAALPGAGKLVYSLDLSRDGRWLAVYSADESIQVWDLESRMIHKTLPASYHGIASLTTSTSAPMVRFSSDGLRLFAGCGDGARGGEVRSWSVPSFESQPSLTHESPAILALAVSANGDRLAAGAANGKLQWWDLSTGKLLWEVQAAPFVLETVAISPDGSAIATAGPSGEIHVRDVQGRLIHALQGYQGHVCSLAFSPEAGGRLLACGYGNGGVMVWDTVKLSQRSFLSARGVVHSITYEPHGRWIVAGIQDGRLLLWDQDSVQARTSFGSQGYAFHVRRLPAPGRIVCEISRNGAVLRREEQEVVGDRVTLIARRDGDALRLQVNQNAPLIFGDVFPPQRVENGVWGVLLGAESGLDRLVVRQAADVQQLSSLEQGEALYRSGRFGEALAFFDEQILASVGDDKLEARREAQVRAAQCLIHQNRREEAIQRLEQVAASSVDDASPWPLVARFELWLLLMRLHNHSAASDLFAAIRATHSPDAVAAAVSAETRGLIFDEYTMTIAQRKSVLRPGALAQVEAALAVAEYFRLSENLNQGTLAQLLSCLRMLGRNEEAAAVARRMVDYRESPEVQRYVEVEEAPSLSPLLSFAYRLSGRGPQLAAQLDQGLWSEPGRLKEKVDRVWLPALLERARLHAAQSQWQETSDCLELLLAHPEIELTLPAVRIHAHLLRGFALQHLNRTEESRRAWVEGCKALNLAEVLESDFAEGGIIEVEDVLSLTVLAAVADQLHDADVERCFSYISKRAAALGSAGQLTTILPAPTAALLSVWRTPRGSKIAESIARHDLTVGEQVQQFLQLSALQLVLLGAWSEAPSHAEEEMIWQTAETGFRAYLNDSLSIAGFLQLGLAWKGIPPPLGWKFCFSGTPNNMRGPAAYYLGKRMQKRGRPDDFQALMKLALEWSEGDEVLRDLATESLKQR